MMMVKHGGLTNKSNHQNGNAMGRCPVTGFRTAYLLGCYKSNILDTENGCTQIVVVALVPRNFGGPEFHGLEPLPEHCLGNVS